MRICHLSDTHGKFPLLKGNYDIVVHSGDWLPDFKVSPHLYAEAQEAWIKVNIGEIKSWIKSAPFLFCQGNHDFANPNRVEQILRQAGINAFNLENKIVSINDYKFYGFPYVPSINGTFNYECDEQEMFHQVDELTSIMNQTYIDVLVAHCPIYGVLSTCSYASQNWGNKELETMFQSKLDQNLRPQAVLCGHIHSASGIQLYKDMLVSNAATTQNIVVI